MSTSSCARLKTWYTVSLVVLLSGCGAGGLASQAPSTWYRPAVETTWQWQLQGEINANYDVDLYDIDLFDAPSTLIDGLQRAGKRVICYFSAGSFEPWRPDAERFSPQDLGKPVEGFAQERWLDVRTDGVRQRALSRLDLAVKKRCDGVEPDNVDGFANDTGFALSAADQLSFNRFLAQEAHGRALAVGLKNDLEQLPALLDLFDFSVNEQCHEFDECEQLEAFIDAGKPVFNAEYAQRFAAERGERRALCQHAKAQNLHTLVLPLALDDAFRFSCDEAS